jgi:hypothetical protein
MTGVRLLLGPALVIASVASYGALLFGGWLPRGLWQVPWPFELGAAVGFALALVAALRNRRRAAWIGLGLTAALGLAFVTGVPLATALPPVASGTLARGTVAPDFTLPSTGGGVLTLSALRGRKVAVVFHRGYW